MIVLVGFMGAGKTSVGRLLAERRGETFIDTDAVVEEKAGKIIAALFKEDGEEAFRRIETEVIRESLEVDNAVLAIGGGALGSERTRTALETATVVYLKTSYNEALHRVGGDERRPMLQREDLPALFAERVGMYEAAADLVVETDGLSPDDVASRVEGALAARPGVAARVELGDRAYEIFVGTGMAERVAGLIPDDVEKVFMVTHPTLVSIGEPIEEALRRRVRGVKRLEVPEGEASKSLEHAQDLFRQLATAPAHRGDVIVALGGGVVGDLAGFVASTYARGIRLIQVPTSLLAQVDAAIGGKTAVNLPEGKNLVGTFHQPLGVVADVSSLRTLPEAELRSGLAEVVKYGLIAEPDLLGLVTASASRIFARDEEVLGLIVARSAAIKAAIVSEDETEQGKRAWLNYGHTIGHAIEKSEAHAGIRHGEAVALGMMAAAYLAEDLGRIDERVVALHRSTLEAVGLPVRADLDPAALEEAWLRDKKYDGGVRFVLLRGLGLPEAGIRVEREAIDRALKRVAE